MINKIIFSLLLSIITLNSKAMNKRTAPTQKKVDSHIQQEQQQKKINPGKIQKNNKAIKKQDDTDDLIWNIARCCATLGCLATTVLLAHQKKND